MYQSFTGSGRRPRQVNLSGRTPGNPFEKPSVVASAQQDRINRQLQRERTQASSRIQKVFRGHSARRKTYKIWRQIWDEAEDGAGGRCGYPTAGESLRQLRRLLLFFSPRAEETDVSRLAWYGTKQVTTSEKIPCDGEDWSAAYARLRTACIQALRDSRSEKEDKTILGILTFATRHSAMDSRQATEYFGALASPVRELPRDSLQAALLAPLTQSKEAYGGLAALLSTPLDTGTLRLLSAHLNTQYLTEAISIDGLSMRGRVWLLGNLITLGGDRDIVGQLLGSLADDVDFESSPLDLDNKAFDSVLQSTESGFPLNTFLHQKVSSLLDQSSVRNLLTASNDARRDGSKAQSLASYALTLLRCFPRHSDEIRMWLHLGPTRSDASSSSPTRYLWDAAKQTHVFGDIWSTSRGVVQILKSQPSLRDRDDWTVLLVFLEMFAFDLKIMDDEEFMDKSPVSKRNSAVSVSNGDVGKLVTFLKNLGFTLYFDAAELNNSGPESVSQVRDQSSLFSGRRLATPATKPETGPLLVARLPGLTIDYLKGVITGLLRAIYERDSRRGFLPKDHWLMIDRFDMTTFIPGVVAEEESRHLIQEQDDEDKDDESDDDLQGRYDTPRTGIGSHARLLRSQEARARAQRKASRKRHLESVAPRLEILQNMPFFIPFHTRVQIFRQFVNLDQEKRRNGYLDPDLWRQSMMFQSQSGMPHRDLARHHAKIKRSQEFIDAYEQFYELGADLKEPIQITFVDQWDMPEAGIDGGGVTKEFLTSVISQAFAQDQGTIHTFFIENEQHLLYPNPTIFEDLKIYYQSMGFSEKTPEVREAQRELYRQYEFLGRIIGKCLYEGILVDVNFAGFFLKKWALTGGTGSAPSESHYRPNINDLRELDEGLYRGLLQVKNSDNAEALGMTFSVNDAIGPPDEKRIVEVDLMPRGGDIAVTNENRLQYINRIAAYRLQNQAARQTRAFLRGLSDIIQPSWLSMFNQTELQTLIGGAAAEIDIADLRRNTLYGGTYVIGTDGLEHPSIQLFWRVMSTMADEDRRKLLKFVTSTPRGPLLGFGHLNPKFSIRDSGNDENRYPTTSTCVNLLKLPMYKSEKVLREKLLAAVNSGAGFDLS